MRCLFPLLIGCLACGGTVRAATVTYTSNTISLTTTNWSSALSLRQFDPALGTLQSATVRLYGQLDGSASVESMDEEPTVVSISFAANLTLSRPDGGAVVVVTLPNINTVFNAGAFDGGIDFAGTSGAAFTGLSAASSDAATLTGSADLALFTGTGFLTSPLRAVGASYAQGGGNLLALFHTRAGGYADVVYDYIEAAPPVVPPVDPTLPPAPPVVQTPDPTAGPILSGPGPVGAVPEPASWALMATALGLVGAGLRRRRPAAA